MQDLWKGQWGQGQFQIVSLMAILKLHDDDPWNNSIILVP